MNFINFTKMQGLGNDYIYIDCLESTPCNLASLSREMSDRHLGVGGDGIILILPSKVANFKMRIFNADGTEARMCGNGARCVAKYVYDNSLTSNLHVTLETLSGVKHLFLKPGNDGKIHSVTVDMGLPSFLTKDIPITTDKDTFINSQLYLPGGDTLTVTSLSMGNPHTVIFVDNLEDIDIEATGKAVENHEIFPDRTNVEFVQVISPDEIRMRVWERGSGVTMACGTGACASIVAAYKLGLINAKATVHLDGGDLFIELDQDNGHVLMTGPATTVFTGTYKRQING